jgi:hypothetical protein
MRLLRLLLARLLIMAVAMALIAAADAISG